LGVDHRVADWYGDFDFGDAIVLGLGTGGTQPMHHRARGRWAPQQKSWSSFESSTSR
jgi:hypothetical protein